MSSSLVAGPLIAPGDADRPRELIEGPGQRWFAWGYHWTVLRVRTRDGVHESLISRDKSSTVPGTARGASWVASWRLQKYGTRSEA